MVPSGMNRPAAKTGRGKIAVLCGLAMVLAALGFRMIKPNLESTVAAAPAAGAAAVAPVAAATLAAPAGKRNVIKWPEAAARDPFQSAKVYPPQAARIEPAKATPVTAAPVPEPVNVEAVARGSIHLKGTVQRGDRSLAMVNGRLCKVGEFVAGFRIAEIGKRTIVVEQGGTRVVIEPE